MTTKNTELKNVKAALKDIRKDLFDAYYCDDLETLKFYVHDIMHEVDDLLNAPKITIEVPGL